MSDLIERLPKTIKAWPWNDKDYAGQWHQSGHGETVEYIRADVAAAEITRLTEALADGSFYKESDIDALQDKIASLTEALAASEEARRAERAAVVREIVETLKEEQRRHKWGVDQAKVERNLEEINKNAGAFAALGFVEQTILALSTDADNAALDKLLREARKEGMERAALAVTERADQENEFATIHEKRGNGYKAGKAARVVTTLRGVAAHIRILAALEAP